jgi:hypothetical protein
MAPPSILVGRFHGSNHMLAKSDVRDAAAGCTFAATLGWRPYDQLHGIGRLEGFPADLNRRDSQGVRGERVLVH